MNQIHEHDQVRLDKLMDGDALQQWAATHIRNLVTQRIRDYGEIEHLDTLVYLPGHWQCPKCDFYLVSTSIHAPSGSFAANLDPQQCANGCGPMWRVTHEQSANQMVDRMDKMTAEIGELTKRVEEMQPLLGKQKTEIEQLQKDALRLDYLETEMAHEHEPGAPRALFRRNVPITRATIDADMVVKRPETTKDSQT